MYLQFVQLVSLENGYYIKLCIFNVSANFQHIQMD